MRCQKIIDAGQPNVSNAKPLAVAGQHHRIRVRVLHPLQVNHQHLPLGDAEREVAECLWCLPRILRQPPTCTIVFLVVAVQELFTQQHPVPMCHADEDQKNESDALPKCQGRAPDVLNVTTFGGFCALNRLANSCAV